MNKKALVFLLLALAIFSLSGCTKDKQEEPTTPALEVIEPETTEPEVLETLPEAETRSVGDGKTLEELSEKAGLPVITIKPVEEAVDSSSEAQDSTNSTDSSDADSSLSESGAVKSGESAVSETSEQSNNGGDTEVVGIDQEVFNEMQDKYEAEANEIFNDPEVIKQMEEMMTGGK